MNIGMLWFDNTQELSLKARIERAVDYYRRKYHQEPTLCLVHPAMMEKKEDKLAAVGTMEVRPLNYVLPGHLWIGMKDAKA